MQIQTSLDWIEVGGELTKQLNNLPYNLDLRRFIHNIDKMVVELSKAEVEARRIRKNGYAIYANSRTAGNGVTVTEYVMGKPSREIVALGYKAKAMGITL